MTQKEIIFSDLGALCNPKTNISNERTFNIWTAYPYETDKISGTMLLAPSNSKPETVVLTPKLLGWYKIFIGLYGGYYRQSTVDLKLTGDGAFQHCSTSFDRRYGDHFVEDVFWRCAEMDGKELFVGKLISEAVSEDAALAWVRFVPMDADEIEMYLQDMNDKDNKRLYATDDIYEHLCFYDLSNHENWKSIVEGYIHSDVEWLAIENLSLLNRASKIPDEFSFTYSYQKNCFDTLKKQFSYNTLDSLVEYGKSKGIKMCVSLRIAQWGMEYPEDELYFEDQFANEHPEYRCVDRDGDVLDYLSFAFPKVQDYIIEEFVRMAETGCNAVQSLFSRGWPFVLFEEPFVKRFYEKYNEDPCVLPLDDERIIAVKCEIMTDFMRRLRKRLDDVRSDNRVELHAKVLFSVYDNLLVGLDIEQWAKEGLVDLIISDQRRIREVFDETVWQDEAKQTIDINKYTDFARRSKIAPVRYDYDEIFPPFQDSTGKLAGPDSQKQRIKEFMAFEKKYGMKVYIEIMPRQMSCEEIKRRALEIYECGCDHIGLWDTYSRVRRKVEWTMWRRIGHKKELAEMKDGEEELYNVVRVLRLGAKNVRSYKPMWGG